MSQLDLPLSYSTTDTGFQKARLLELWCAEPIFFASRELSDTYYTEGTIGNYALAYALGWARSPYYLTGNDTGRPKYLEDLTPLANQGYILPAWPLEGKPSFRFERFNALSDPYWYLMARNRVATEREDLPLARQLAASGKIPNSLRASNFPQTGRLRVIERGNRFQTLVLGDRPLPEYIRVGKFMSKVRVDLVQTWPVTELEEGIHQCSAYLNVADIPSNLEMLSFDLISMPPASLLKNLQFRGVAWQIGDFTLPAHLNFCGGQHEPPQN
ncbi:type I-D CRISPR-associated protein Cas5/Csc1 [Leptolyngbya sp. FACHB-16]|uniref:type I-D CRISPR-associated protein Cas5/Csc1 n=1 Tax=unclassified Leptolyngbya TaxID=2650499 RepID=UPI001688A406|nr:type I-D CRISPR-associated protein Cas5/Csc1 [Leptolyngbya sp. FACHB-16]MBD2153173.1 type I-D CRISPR-associated protein Cas5/Csc1 [Leptolyngbya sp. FACHB-16]